MRTRSAVAALKMDLKALSRTAWAVVFAYPSSAVLNHNSHCAILGNQEAGKRLTNHLDAPVVVPSADSFSVACPSSVLRRYFVNIKNNCEWLKNSLFGSEAGNQKPELRPHHEPHAITITTG